MDSHSETEEQRDPSCSSHWRTITHLAPDPLPCLSRLIFHSSAEQCHGLSCPVSSPMRCKLSRWGASCQAATSGMLSLWEDQRLMLSATDAGAALPHSPNSFTRRRTSTLWGLLCWDWHEQGQLAWSSCGDSGCWTGSQPQPWSKPMRYQAVSPQALVWDLVKSHQNQDNLKEAVWTAQWFGFQEEELRLANLRLMMKKSQRTTWCQETGQ